MSRRTAFFAVLAVMVVLPAASVAHDLDHPAPSFTDPAAPPTTNFNAGGPGAKWQLLDTLVTGNPHSDLDFFTQGGETYVSVGLLGTSANGGGQSIAKLTEGGKIAPKLISQHPSASCAAVTSSVTGLQHDVEATPKGNVIFNTDVLAANRADTQLLLDASDANGRCHDQGALGAANAPRGGLEIIDVTDPAKPVEIGLTSHIGEAHTVNVDPRRPHIAYAVTSDAVGVDPDGTRANERTPPATPNPTAPGAQPNNLDGFEVVNLKSCLEAPLGTIPPGTDPMAKRDLCKPEVYRFRYPSAAIARGHTVNAPNQGVFGCHELEVYPDDLLTCGSGNAGIVFDISEAFDDSGTPMDFTDDKLRGNPLPCRLRDSSSTVFRTGAKVTDCVTGVKDGQAVDLRVPNWLAIGAPSLAGVNHVGSAFHQGRVATQNEAVAPFNSTQDIDFDHELERTASGKFLIATDERGGGVVPPGATCPTSPADNPQGNGGLHAYSVDRLKQSVPDTAEKAFESYARTPDGKKAIFRARIRTQPQGSFCTAHVLQQIPGQNRIFMGWYSQGTQVVDFVEHRDGSFEFKEAGYFIPENANEWVSHIFKVERNNDGTFTYFGATGDGIIGAAAGRSAIDVYKVTLPAPPAPLGDPIPGAGAGFEPSSCLSRRVKIGPRNIGRLKLGQTRARTAQRARPLGNFSKRTRVLRYCVLGSSKARSAAVFDTRGRLRLAASNARGHTRRGLGRGDSVRKLRKRFGKRLRVVSRGVRIVRAPKRSRSRVVFVMRANRVRYVAIVDRRVATKKRMLQSYLRRTQLGRR